MPVLEILQLKIKPTISTTNPSILTSLRTVRQSLAQEVHPTHSRFYQSIEDPYLIYVFGLWDSLSQHHDFLSSPLRTEILLPQEDLLDFSWCIHIEIDSMQQLPLEAPIVAIARIKLKSGDHHVKTHEAITARYRSVLEERTRPFGVVEGRRVDGGVEGGKEEVVITGWETKEDHLAFGVGLREKNEDYRGLREHWEGVEASHVRHMER
jgi:heme-degrading monooxygenase HmoA